MFLSQSWWPIEQGSWYGCPASQHSPFRKRRQLRITEAVLASPGPAFSGLTREEGSLGKQAQKKTSRHVWKGAFLSPASPREGDNNAVSLAISSFILWASLLLILEQTQMLCNGAEQTLLNQSLRRSGLATTTELPVPVAKIGDSPQHCSCDNRRKSNSSEKLGPWRLTTSFWLGAVFLQKGSRYRHWGGTSGGIITQEKRSEFRPTAMG